MVGSLTFPFSFPSLSTLSKYSHKDGCFPNKSMIEFNEGKLSNRNFIISRNIQPRTDIQDLKWINEKKMKLCLIWGIIIVAKIIRTLNSNYFSKSDVVWEPRCSFEVLDDTESDPPVNCRSSYICLYVSQFHAFIFTWIVAWLEPILIYQK